MKSLHCLNHPETGADALLSAKGMTQAQNKTPRGKYTHLFYGTSPDANCQTLLAIVSAQGIKAELHSPIEEFGNERFFNAHLNTQSLMGMVTDRKTALEAILTFFPEKVINQLALYAFSGVKKMFTFLEEGQTGLTIGHDLMIQLSIIGAGYPDLAKSSLKSLKLHKFIMKDNGEIYVPSE